MRDTSDGRSGPSVQEAMSFGSLELLRSTSFAWRLLASHQAPFVISFLYRVFLAENVREVSEQELLGRLENYKDMLNAGSGEDRFPRSAKEYLTEWADDGHGWLRRFYPAGKDEPYYDMTSQAQKAIEWLSDQGAQSYIDFIGTESRLISVFDILRQIIEGTERDPRLRIQNLETQKAAIEQEIEDIHAGKIAVYDETQIRERFAQALTIAREILTDFRSVEQNFRDLDRGVREKISTWGKGKGALLQEIFENQDGIARSEQGKSFSAFWKFLMSPTSQEKFQSDLESVLRMKPVREMNIPRNIRDVHYDWVNAGAYVQETVARLNGQLRRYVDENYIEEERRILQLVRDIEGKALAVRNTPPKVWDAFLDAVRPELFLPMDRPLWSPREKPVIAEAELMEDDGEISLEALYIQIYVDKEQLNERIDRMLQSRDSAALSEILEIYPLEKGLSELVAYLSIASERPFSSFDPELSAEYSWMDAGERTRVVHMPEVRFHKRRQEDISR
ncbi:MAG: DUF3375 domain-containing protein [Peptococcaceae bacterium]|nr:DUF3375 domain-containing protein [Peptococcaceae bacterium]